MHDTAPVPASSWNRTSGVRAAYFADTIHDGRIGLANVVVGGERATINHPSPADAGVEVRISWHTGTIGKPPVC
jgi:hypothetical protein